MSVAWRAAGPEQTDLSVRATPGAGRDALAGVIEGALRVRISAPPVDGAANDPLPLEEVARRIEARLATE